VPTKESAAGRVGYRPRRADEALALSVLVQRELMLVGEEDGFVCVHGSIVRP
jgi:hypothetical protein